MSACTRCRWGTGTTHEKIPDTAASKELQKRLSDVLAERAKQDCMWTMQAPEDEKAPSTQITTTAKSTTKK